MTILLGASGSGKSVILKLILGLLKPDEGSILVNGEPIERMSEHELLRVRENIGIVFQENALFDSLTVEDNVGYRLVEEHLPEDQVHARVEAVLGFIGLSEFIDRLPSELSGGQRRRVAIARAMAPEPSLVLLDDPITGLDPIIAMLVDDEIIKLRDLQHVTSLFVTHQIRDAFYVATHAAVRADGRVRIVSADAGACPAGDVHGAPPGAHPLRGQRRGPEGVHRSLSPQLPAQHAAALVGRSADRPAPPSATSGYNRRMPITLTPRERAQLKARAHALEPVVQVGQAGLSDTVVAELERALTAHELIKVRIGGADRDARKELAAAICARTGAAEVQSVGKVLVLFRPRPDEEAGRGLTPHRPPTPRTAPSPPLRAAPTVRHSFRSVPG